MFGNVAMHAISPCMLSGITLSSTQWMPELQLAHMHLHMTYLTRCKLHCNLRSREDQGVWASTVCSRARHGLHSPLMLRAPSILLKDTTSCSDWDIQASLWGYDNPHPQTTGGVRYLGKGDSSEHICTGRTLSYNASLQKACMGQ